MSRKSQSFRPGVNQSGTAMDTLEKGTFFIRNVGKCEVFLNPENTEFLHFPQMEQTII